MPLVENLKYKDIVELAESNNQALLKTIRQLGGSSVSDFSDEELCSSFLNVYMSMNKPSTSSKKELQKATGLDLNKMLNSLKMKGARRNYNARSTKSVEAIYSILNYELVMLSNLSDDAGMVINAKYNAFTLLDLFQNKHYDGIIIEESGNKVHQSVTLRTLTPMLVRLGNNYLVGNTYTNYKTGAKTYGIHKINGVDTLDMAIKGGCYNMTLKQFFSSIMYYFLDYFNLGELLYLLVDGNYSSALNDTFVVTTAKGTSLIPLYKEKNADGKNCLYIHRGYEVGNIESQLCYLRQFKDTMNMVAPRFIEEFEEITDERFNEFCKSVILYSAFDKESQGDYSTEEGKARVVNLL